MKIFRLPEPEGYRRTQRVSFHHHGDDQGLRRYRTESRNGVGTVAEHPWPGALQISGVPLLGFRPVLREQKVITADELRKEPSKYRVCSANNTSYPSDEIGGKSDVSDSGR